MEKAALEKLVERGLSTRAIAVSLGTSQTGARYWMRKYSLSTQPKLSAIVRKCCQCGEIDPAKFYGHKRAICGSCHNAYNIKQGRDKRLRAVRELGGRCQACGFNRYMCSLDFHHKIRRRKTPTSGLCVDGLGKESLRNWRNALFCARIVMRQRTTAFWKFRLIELTGSSAAW